MTNKQEENGCRARLIIGCHLAKTWSQCEFRLKGTCCKDCERLKNCQSPCSFMYPYYQHETKNYNLDKFKCMYFMTEIEAVIRRLDTNKKRGIIDD